LREICKKKYINIDEFNRDACHLTEYVKNNTFGMTDNQKISYAREVFNKNILDSCILIGYLNAEIQNLLKANTNKLYFSMDNMIKNRLAHPEINDEDYAKISYIIKSPSKYYKTKNGYDVILFKADTKFYKLVIKTTKNRKENFVKSLHLLNEERYNKY